MMKRIPPNQMKTVMEMTRKRMKRLMVRIFSGMFMAQVAVMIGKKGRGLPSMPKGSKHMQKKCRSRKRVGTTTKCILRAGMPQTTGNESDKLASGGKVCHLESWVQMLPPFVPRGDHICVFV